MNLLIRSARADDVDVICEFNRLLALETENKKLDPVILNAGVVAMLGDSHKGRYFVAQAEGRIVGQLGVTLEWSDWRNGNFWWIQSVYVALDARRQGVFRELYEFVLKEAKETPGVIGVRLYVEHDNTAAQSTYRSMGMVMAGYEVMETILAPLPPGEGFGVREMGIQL